MLTPTILASIEAERHWSWETRDAWGWLTECQQMRDLVDERIRQLSCEEFASFLQTYDFEQHREWFFEHYYDYRRAPKDPKINWRVIVDRWVAFDPAHTMVEDIQACYSDRWYEYTQVYPDDGPLSMHTGTVGGMHAGGGAWIMWRGHQIEHYTYPYQQLSDARALTARCLYLEELGLSVPDVVAYENWFLAMEPGHPYVHLLSDLLCYNVWEDPGTGKIAFTRMHNLEDAQGKVRVLYFDGRVWHKVRRYDETIAPWAEVKAGLGEDKLSSPFHYHAMERLGWISARMGQEEYQGQCYAPLEGVIAWLQSKNIFPNFFEREGGPWCGCDDAAQCSGCAGQIHL